MERKYPHNVSSSSSSPVPTIVTLGNIDGHSSITHTTIIKDASSYPMINHPKQLATIRNNQLQQQIISNSAIRQSSKSEPSQLNQSVNHQHNYLNNNRLNQNPGFLWLGESAISGKSKNKKEVID